MRTFDSITMSMKVDEFIRAVGIHYDEVQDKYDNLSNMETFLKGMEDFRSRVLLSFESTMKTAQLIMEEYEDSAKGKAEKKRKMESCAEEIMETMFDRAPHYDISSDTQDFVDFLRILKEQLEQTIAFNQEEYGHK